MVSGKRECSLYTVCIYALPLTPVHCVFPPLFKYHASICMTVDQWVWGGLSWTCLLSYWVLSYFIWSSKSFICEETKSFRIFSFFCNHSKYVTPMSTDCGAHLRPATCTDMLENSSVLYILWLEDAHSSVRREANGIELVHPTLICGIKNIYRILKWFVFFTSHVNLHLHFTKE